MASNKSFNVCSYKQLAKKLSCNVGALSAPQGRKLSFTFHFFPSLALIGEICSDWSDTGPCFSTEGMWWSVIILKGKVSPEQAFLSRLEVPEIRLGISGPPAFCSRLSTPLLPSLYLRTLTSPTGRFSASSSSLWQLVLGHFPDEDLIAHTAQGWMLRWKHGFFYCLLSFVHILVQVFYVGLSLDCSSKVSPSNPGVMYPKTH